MVVVILVRMIVFQLVQELDHIGVGAGASECVPCAIEAEDELVNLMT